MNHTMKRHAAALALGVTLSGCGLHGKPKVDRTSDDGPAAMPANGLSTAQPGVPPEQAGGLRVVAPGVVEPWGGLVELAGPEPGLISQMLAAEGAVVDAGELLAVLEDDLQRQAVELARAQLAEAEATLSKIEAGATPEELRQVQAEYDAASALGEFASASAIRVTKLHQDGTVSDNDADRAAADARAQSAAAERAQARLQELMRGARTEDLHAARARTEAARARLRLAEAELERRRILAPADGTVLLSRFHPGEFYSAEAGPLFVFGDMRRLQVRLEVDEIHAGDVRVGVPCTLYSDGGELLAEGAVARLAPSMGRRGLSQESPTARVDVRVREVFIEVPATAGLVPGQRVWGHTQRSAERIHR